MCHRMARIRKRYAHTNACNECVVTEIARRKRTGERFGCAGMGSACKNAGCDPRGRQMAGRPLTMLPQLVAPTPTKASPPMPARTEPPAITEDYRRALDLLLEGQRAQGMSESLCQRLRTALGANPWAMSALGGLPGTVPPIMPDAVYRVVINPWVTPAQVQACQARVRQLSAEQREAADKVFDMLFNASPPRIEPSSAQVSSSIVVVPKAGGGWRVAVDYRRINALLAPRPSAPMKEVGPTCEWLSKFPAASILDPGVGILPILDTAGRPRRDDHDLSGARRVSLGQRTVRPGVGPGVCAGVHGSLVGA